MEKIQQYKIQSSMRYILNLVKRLFDAPVPEFVLYRLASYRPSSFEDKIFDILANPEIIKMKQPIAEFLTINGVSLRLRYLFGKLFPGKYFLQRIYADKGKLSSNCLWVADVLWRGIKALFQISTKQN